MQKSLHTMLTLVSFGMMIPTHTRYSRSMIQRGLRKTENTHQQRLQTKFFPSYGKHYHRKQHSQSDKTPYHGKCVQRHF